MFESVMNFSFAFDPDIARLLVVLACVISAAVIGPFLAFKATPDAGIGCPLAFLRLLHRISLVLFSVALGYLALFIVDNQDYVPATPAVFVMVGVFVTTMISGIRHSYALPIPQDNTWSALWRGLKHGHLWDEGHPGKLQAPL